jgi:hypothetical protein
MNTATATRETELETVDLNTQIGREMFSPHPWYAKTHHEFNLHGKRAKLEIHTFKSDRTLRTRATVSWVSKDGGGYIHRMGIGGGGDFSVLAYPDQIQRCTQSSIKEHHANALVNFAAIKARAINHYPTPETALQDAQQWLDRYSQAEE